MTFFASDPSAPAPPDSQDSQANPPKIYRCGTLSYTKRALVALFAWTLWGDFCNTMMDTVMQSALPLNLKDLGASNKLMSLISVVLPSFLTLTIGPWISFKSDRHRSPRGRRIPFILYALPFLTISLLMLGWSRDIAAVARHVIPQLEAVAPNTVTITVIAVFMVAYMFFDMFVGAGFSSLFNDVVPPQFFGRFMGLYKVVGLGAGTSYSFFLMRYASTNMREIFTGVAIVYFVCFGLICLRVKEGEYPPPGTLPPGVFSGVKAFFFESFSVKLYWYLYLMTAFTAAANCASYATIFFQQEMGLSLQQWGWLLGISQVAAFAGTYFTAIFMDRWHPYRVAAYMAVFGTIIVLAQWVWVPVTLPAKFYFWLTLGNLMAIAFADTLQNTCYGPLAMRIKPRTRFGQLGAANSMLRSVSRIIFGMLVGVFMDGMLLAFKSYGPTFGYRFQFVWRSFFACVAAVFVYLGYREWRRLGGDNNYRPPAPWMPGGFDPLVDKVRSVLTRPRTLRLALNLNVLCVAINALVVPVLMFYMWRKGMAGECHLYAVAVLPAAVILALLAWLQMGRVQRDVAARMEGLPTKLGVPHHGILLTVVIQNLLLCPVWVWQVVVAINLGMGRAVLVFGVANVLTTAAGLFGIHLIRWMERDVPGSLFPEPPLQEGPIAVEALEPVSS